MQRTVACIGGKITHKYLGYQNTNRKYGRSVAKQRLSSELSTRVNKKGTLFVDITKPFTERVENITDPSFIPQSVGGDDGARLLIVNFPRHNHALI